MTDIIEGEIVDEELSLAVRTDSSPTLFGTTDPAAVVEAATAAAIPLAAKVHEQRLSVKIGQGEHVKVEGWQLLGSMLGVFAVPDGDPEPVELDGAWGFKARMKAVTRNGDVVGGGTSYCMRSETRWATADIYAIASMAQTRATSKALKGPLGFVMKLAGFESTPAEEMPRDDERRKAKPSSSFDIALEGDIGELIGLSDRLGVKEAAEAAIEEHRSDPKFAAWISAQLKKARAAAEAKDAEPA